MLKNITIGWKVNSLNFNIASFRYRAILPILALDSLVKSKVFADPCLENLTGLDALVIVKSFTFQDYMLAQEAVKNKIPVIFDLCDNIFINKYGASKSELPSDIFLFITNHLNAIVVTTEKLADIVRENTGNRIPIYVVPDGIETPALLLAAKKRFRLPQNKFFYWLTIKRHVTDLVDTYKVVLNEIKVASVKYKVRRLQKVFVNLYKRF